jgi:hypothetical protein
MKNTEKLVRCLLTKKKGSKNKSETRFIPYQEFELWKYYISRQYDYTVSDEEIFLWFPQEEFDRKKDRLDRLDGIPVHKVTLYFFLKNDGVLVPVTRFFQKSDFPKVKPLFLKHFEEFQDEKHLTKVLEHIQEEKGVCLKNIKIL